MPVYGAGSNPNLHQSGAVVPIQFAISTAYSNVLRNSGQPIPAPVRMNALMDTGAVFTAVRQGLLAPLGLQPVGVRTVGSASAAGIQCPTYSVMMLFPTGTVNMFWQGTVVEMALPGMDCLIGRDVLAFGVFVYSGITASWTFSL